ncbi:peptidylprolyl isomerase [Azovibrio restrictus]|uniref:peptidylprolyl isomerase n=1 Tax=Azovibrio restrictus TaxID=146938 RepID=UPI0026EBC92B|nr:peptidylprolyl isomerase [Azovibrio restrictus]
MLKLTRLSLALVAGALISAPALAQSKAFVTVNGQAVPQYVADAFINEQKAQGAQDNPEFRNAVKEELIRRELLVNEARKKGLDKKSDIMGQMEIARQAILIRAFIADYLKANPVSDAQLKKDYDAFKAQLGGTEYKARHILVEKEEDAKAIIAKLDKGDKFADLAKQSRDPGSKDKGGDLGWSVPGAFVKPFADAMVKLDKGRYTKEPVKSDFGYHVILLEDTRALTPPPFEQLKPQLTQRANQQKVEQLIEELRSKAKVN